MTYSLDMRERAVGFVRAGGDQLEAARIFGINRKTLYRWQTRKDLAPKICGPRRRKLREVLIPELRPNSLVIMDNAPFHNKPTMQALLEAHGHSMLPLPKYSPDLNPIEQSFAILKRRRQFSHHSLEHLLNVGHSYVN